MVIGKTHGHLCPEIRRAFKKEPLLIVLGLRKRGHNYIKPSSFTVPRPERNQRKWPNMRPDWNQLGLGNGRVDRLRWTEMAEQTSWSQWKWSGRKWKLDGGSKCQQWLADRKLWNSVRLEKRIGLLQCLRGQSQGFIGFIHRINSNGTSP